jgi:DNA helicase-2/ATP-dependent DNA helicase PcrA
LKPLGIIAFPVTDKIIDYEEERKILLLKNMIKSPYFARFP